MTLNKGEVGRYIATIFIVMTVTAPFMFIYWMNGADVLIILNTWPVVGPAWLLRFVLHKYWVFKNNLPRYIRQPALYAVIVVTTFGILSYVQYVLMTYLQVSKWWAAGIAGLVIGLGRFVLFRWVFRN